MLDSGSLVTSPVADDLADDLEFSNKQALQTESSTVSNAPGEKHFLFMTVPDRRNANGLPRPSSTEGSAKPKIPKNKNAYEDKENPKMNCGIERRRERAHFRCFSKTISIFRTDNNYK